MGMTIAEKILAKHAGLETVTPGQFIMASVDRVRLQEEFGNYYLDTMKTVGVDTLWDSDKVVLAIEHQVPPSTVGAAEACAGCRRFAKKFGLKNFFEMGRHGICHVLFVEKGFAKPGDLIVANDSHTCTYGALNCAARGVGCAEMSYILKHGKIWFKVPESIRIVIEGKMPEGVYSKDIILFLAGKYGPDMARYCSIEFCGPVVDELSLEARLTISNMGVELGAKFALFNADQKVIEYLKDRVQEPFEPVFADPDAVYRETIHVDVSGLEPYVTKPHDLSNSRPLAESEGIHVDQAFLGSCTNGRIEDLRVAASILKGHSVARDTRLLVIPASQEVYRQAMHEGLLDVFLDAGAMIDGPTCGPCSGGKGVLAAGERCISSTNRNFKGRMGSPDSEVYLASPATVAASAIAGYITDPRPYLEGKK